MADDKVTENMDQVLGNTFLIHWSKQIDDSNCYDFKLLHP